MLTNGTENHQPHNPDPKKCKTRDEHGLRPLWIECTFGKNWAHIGGQIEMLGRGVRPCLIKSLLSCDQGALRILTFEIEPLVASHKFRQDPITLTVLGNFSFELLELILRGADP